MSILTKNSIGQAVFVVGYKRDPTIRTKQFDIEKALEPLIKVPSVNTNLPDDYNPQAPRVTLGDGRVSVHFSQNAAQLTVNVDNTDDKSIGITKSSITEQVNLFQSCLDKIITPNQQNERGLVLTVQYPVDMTKTSEEAIFEYIQSNFMKISPLGIPASAGFNVGYKTDDNFFITLSIAQYKMISGEIPAMQSSQWIDFSTLSVIESGIELKLDINSRPMSDYLNQSFDVTNAILNKSFDFILNDSDTFMGCKNETSCN